LGPYTLARTTDQARPLHSRGYPHIASPRAMFQFCSLQLPINVDRLYVDAWEPDADLPCPELSKQIISIRQCHFARECCISETAIPAESA
jgi:hypothetical protein